MMANLPQPGQPPFPGSNPSNSLAGNGMPPQGGAGAGGDVSSSMMPPVTITSSNPLGKAKSGSSWWNPLSWSLGGWLTAAAAVIAGVMARRYLTPAKEATKDAAKEIEQTVASKAHGTGFSFAEGTQK